VGGDVVESEKKLFPVDREGGSVNSFSTLPKSEGGRPSEDPENDIWSTRLGSWCFRPTFLFGIGCGTIASLQNCQNMKVWGTKKRILPRKSIKNEVHSTFE
jgi:hypothetical protein